MIENARAAMNDDPRKLRTMLERAQDLARNHDVPSVVVGLAAETGDLRFPEFIDFLQSSLRVEDAVFRMTRERVVLHLADVDRAMAAEVLERLLGNFVDEFPSSSDPSFETRYVEVRPSIDELRVRDVLPTLFGAAPGELLH